ncbi:MAG: mechanosensitive ion channel family protein [Crocinitomix sp.]|nr:mechanosensitive ion channel family protein [Crocinitomix sp.]
MQDSLNPSVNAPLIDEVISNESLSFFDKLYYGNTIEQYLIAFGIILAAIIGGKILYWISKKFISKLTARTKSKLDDIIADKLEEPVVFGIVLGVSWWALSTKLNYSDGGAFTGHVFGFLTVINITWMIARFSDALIEEYIVPLTEKSESDLDDQLLPIFRKGLRIIIWTLGIIVGLNNAGYDVGAVIAGLGIGGLAFALAAQDTIKNFFGGIMIFADKPFALGDRIQIGDIDGWVREIGIRSTRVETLAGRIVTVPNSMFSDDAVENVDIEPTRKVKLGLGLTYDTTADQMEGALALLKKIANDHKDIIDDDIFMGFDSFGDFALGITFIYFIRKDADIFETQTKMNLAILRQFGEHKLDMAFPTQTVYHQSLTA